MECCRYREFARDSDRPVNEKTVVDQSASHDHRVLAASHRRIVVTPPSDLIEAITFVQPERGAIAVTHFQEAFTSLSLIGNRHQMLQQPQAEPATLVLRLDGNIE